MGKIGDLWVRLGLKKSEFTAGLDEAQKQTQTFSQKVKSHFAGLVTKAAALTAAFAAIGRGIADIVKNVATFERANSELAAVLGTNLKGIEQLSNSAKQLGRTSEFTASEVTQLQIALARLGFDTGQIEAMQGSVLKFAQAMGTDLGSAAEFTGSALRAFGLQASDTNDLLDVMSASTTASALNFSKLQTSISVVAPIAKSFGLDIRETASFLGVLANNGFDASSAATALRNILLNLADSNGKLAKGIGHTARTFPEIINAFQELKEKGVDVGEILEMTDRRSAAAAAALIDQADAAGKLKEKLDGAQGSLDTMSETMKNNLIGSVKSLQSAWEGLTLAFEGSKGPMKWIVDRLTDILNRMTDILEGDKVSFWEVIMGPVAGGAITGARNRRREANQPAPRYVGPPQSAVALLRAQKEQPKGNTNLTLSEEELAKLEKAREKAERERIAALREEAQAVREVREADEEMLEVEARNYESFRRMHDLGPAPLFDNDTLRMMNLNLKETVDYMEEIENLGPALQASLDECVEKAREGLERMDNTAENLARTFTEELVTAIEDGLVGAFESLANVLGGVTEGGMGQVVKALIEPLADMAIRAGTLIMMSGTAIEALKDSLIGFFGGSAIFAGGALVAVGLAAKAGLAAIGNKGSGATGVTRYGADGGSAYGAGTITKELTVNVVGTIHGSDIILSGDNTLKNWGR